MLRTHLHSQARAHTHTGTLCTSTTIAEHVIQKCNNHSQTTELPLSAAPNLSTHQQHQRFKTVPVQRKKIIRFSISSVVCSSLHLNRKEESVWAITDERHHKSFSFCLFTIYHLIKSRSGSLPVRYCMPCEATVKKQQTSKEATQRKIW